MQDHERLRQPADERIEPNGPPTPSPVRQPPNARCHRAVGADESKGAAS
jgi:hypothetical protein